jgi:hypothetical protein
VKETSMKRRVAVVLLAAGFALGTPSLGGVASPAMAYPAGIPYFDENNNYMGCESSYTGEWFTPDQVTFEGCLTDENEVPV